MAKTLSDVRSLVRSYLDEATAADWTNAELNTLINQRYHRVYTQVVTVFEDYYLTTDLFNSTANQKEYGSADGLATDIYKIRRLEVNYDVSNANSVPMRALPISTIEIIRRDLGEANIASGIRGNAGYYTFGHGSDLKIGITPTPDKTGTNAIKIWYVKKLSDLSSDSDDVNIPYADRYWHLIAEGATADALRFGQQDLDAADQFDAKFDRGLVLMQQELEDKIAEESKTTIDVTGEFIDFEQLQY